MLSLSISGIGHGELMSTFLSSFTVVLAGNLILVHLVGLLRFGLDPTVGAVEIQSLKEWERVGVFWGSGN